MSIWLYLAIPFTFGCAFGFWLRYAERFSRRKAWAGGLLLGAVLVAFGLLMVAL